MAAAQGVAFRSFDGIKTVFVGVPSALESFAGVEVNFIGVSWLFSDTMDNHILCGS